jgi:cell division protein FtsB
MLAGIIFRVDRALGKERLRNERDAARYERNEHLRERDEYHRQLDIALGERNECLRQLDIALGERNECLRQRDIALGERNECLRQQDALIEQIERERTRNSSHDLVSALADALASMTVQRDDLRRERAEIKRELASLTSRVIEPDARSQG